MTLDPDVGRDIDESLGDEAAMRVAFSKFVSVLAGTDADQGGDETADISVAEATFRAANEIKTLQQRVDELEAENAELRTRLDRLGDIGQEKTGKEQKIAAIVTYADNERGDESKHTVSIKNIKGATGVSRRYAYTLAGAMINGDSEEGVIGSDGYDWVLDPAEVPQYGSLEIDKDASAGVTIDFDTLHSHPESVSKFITPAAAQGVAD